MRPKNYLSRIALGINLFGLLILLGLFFYIPIHDKLIDQLPEQEQWGHIGDAIGFIILIFLGLGLEVIGTVIGIVGFRANRFNKTERILAISAVTIGLSIIFLVLIQVLTQ